LYKEQTTEIVNILPNMKAIEPKTSEELHSHSEAGRTNERTDEPMDKLKNSMPPYHRMQGIKTLM